MNSLRHAVRLFLAVGLLGLAGCYDEPGVTRYEPGEYKGASDPLLDKVGTAQHAERMEERFRLVQTDR
jgi:hypothetical protein